MKKFYFVLLLLITIVLLCGCTQKLPSALSKNSNNNYIFLDKYVIIEKYQFSDYQHFCIAYDKDTKVLYDISFDTYYICICPHYINENTVGVYKE